MKAKALYRIAAALFVLFAARHIYGFLSFNAPTAEGAAVLEAMDRAPLHGAATWGGSFVGFVLVWDSFSISRLCCLLRIPA